MPIKTLNDSDEPNYPNVQLEDCDHCFHMYMYWTKCDDPKMVVVDLHNCERNTTVKITMTLDDAYAMFSRAAYYLNQWRIERTREDLGIESQTQLPEI